MATGGSPAEIAIGKIVSPHGVTGAVKVWPYFDSRERYLHLKQIKIFGEKQGPHFSAEMTVSRISAYGKYWLFRLDQIRTREEAQRLKGYQIYISAEERFPLPAGSYYYDQMIGLKVYASGRLVGKLVEIRSNPAHDIYVIGGGEGREILLPAVREFVQEINLEQGSMRVKIPEGLGDL